jgi:RNA polymerase sigma-70 factor (ECF subfamily)
MAADLGVDVELIAAEIPGPEQVDRELLQMAIQELPPEFRLIVLMYYFEQRSYREIAAELEIPMGTVMSRLSRAKSHLRRRIRSAHVSTR